MLNNLQ